WWKAERRDGPRAFALDPQWLPASREDPDVGTLREHVVAELRACIEDVLAVVEQEEEAPIAQRVDQGFRVGASWLLEHAERRGDGVGDARGVGHRGELRHPRPVLERVPGVASRFDRQTRLAASPGS